MGVKWEWEDQKRLSFVVRRRGIMRLDRFGGGEGFRRKGRDYVWLNKSILKPLMRSKKRTEYAQQKVRRTQNRESVK